MILHACEAAQAPDVPLIEPPIVIGPVIPQPTDPSPTRLAITLEAEQATASGATSRKVIPTGFTGSGCIYVTGEDTIEWNVDVQARGLYHPEFRYALRDGERLVNLTANNVPVTTTGRKPILRYLRHATHRRLGTQSRQCRYCSGAFAGFCLAV